MKACQLDRLDQWRAITIIERIAADRGVATREIFDWLCHCPAAVEARHEALFAVARAFPDKPLEWLASVMLCYRDTIRHFFARRSYWHPGVHNANAITREEEIVI